MTVTARQLSVLAVVALAMAVVTVVLYGVDRTPRTEFEKGALLIQGIDLEKVGKIALKEKDKTLSLVQGARGYTVAESSHYPADTKKINELLIKCLEIRIADKVTTDAANHAELGVKEEAEDATLVQFFSSDAKAEGEAKPLVAFIVGKSAARGGGNYVRLAGEDTVYASEETVHLSTSPTSYMATEIVNIKKEDVQQVKVQLKDGAYTIARGKDDKAVLQGIPKGKQAKQSDVDSAFDALSWLSFTEVAPLAKADVKWDATYTCQLKPEKHTTYVLRLAKKGDKHYANILAQGPAPAAIEKARLIRKDASKEELEKKDALLTTADTAADFTAKHKDWAYEVSSWKAEKMRAPLKDLIEDIPKPDEPKEISASHILIAHKGGERADAKVTRTKDEAKKLADKVLKEAKADGADFAALATKHSDGPSKTKGGDLGSFEKGKMHENFEAAAWKLKVGDISGVVETPFGFHIIKRTK